jgi:hypothetical protein
MASKALIATLVAVPVVLGGAVAASFALGGAAAGPSLSFDAGSAVCDDGGGNHLATRSNRSGDGTRLTVRTNVSVSDLGHTVDDATVERVDDGTYALNVTTSEADEDGASAQCVGRIPYEATLDLPEDGKVTVVAYHDGEKHVTLTDSANGSSASASSSASDADA